MTYGHRKCSKIQKYICINPHNIIILKNLDIKTYDIFKNPYPHMHKINDFPFLDSCQPVGNLCNHISAQHTQQLYTVLQFTGTATAIYLHTTPTLSHIENKHKGGVPTSTAHYPASKVVSGIITTTWITQNKGKSAAEPGLTASDRRQKLD